MQKLTKRTIVGTTFIVLSGLVFLWFSYARSPDTAKDLANAQTEQQELKSSVKPATLSQPAYMNVPDAAAEGKKAVDVLKNIAKPPSGTTPQVTPPVNPTSTPAPVAQNPVQPTTTKATPTVTPTVIPTATPTPDTSQNDAVSNYRIFVVCVTPNQDDTYIAYFGYEIYNQPQVYLFISKIEGGEGEAPATLESNGSKTYVKAVAKKSSPVSWNADNLKATATIESTQCPNPSQ